MKRPATKGGLILRSTWLRFLIVFAIFGLVFAVWTHSTQKQIGDRKIPLVAKPATDQQPEEMNSMFDFSVNDIDGKVVSLEKYRNRVSLIVNGATV